MVMSIGPPNLRSNLPPAWSSMPSMLSTPLHAFGRVCSAHFLPPKSPLRAFAVHQHRAFHLRLGLIDDASAAPPCASGCLHLGDNTVKPTQPSPDPEEHPIEYSGKGAGIVLALFAALIAMVVAFAAMMR